MRLGNHGWGVRDMIIYTCILLLFLLVAVYSVNSLYKNIDLSNKQNNQVSSPNDSENDAVDTGVEEEKIMVDYTYYEAIEKRLRNATFNYLEENPYTNEEDILKVTLDMLIQRDYIDVIYDQTGENVCSAYSNVYNDANDNYVVKSYINCSNYRTEGD